MKTALGTAEVATTGEGIGAGAVAGPGDASAVRGGIAEAADDGDAAATGCGAAPQPVNSDATRPTPAPSGTNRRRRPVHMPARTPIGAAAFGACYALSGSWPTE